jgi:hypothetical protein
MRLILLSVLVVVAACTAVAQTRTSDGPSLAEARAVCQAVASGDATFVDVARGYDLSEEEAWTAVDVDNDGTPEDIAILTGGTSHTPGIMLRETPGAPSDYINSSYGDDESGRSFGPWSGQLQLVRSGGRIYEVFYSDADTEDYPVYVAIHLPNHVDRWVCAFRSEAPTPRLAPVAGRENAAPVCAAVAARLHSTEEDFAFSPVEEQYLLETRFYAEGRVDVMNDGRPRNLRRLRLESGAGPGCGTEYYDLSDPQGSEATALRGLQSMDEAPDRYPVRLANGYAACHGNVARFHRIDSAVVFEQRFPGAQPQRHDQELWWVSRVENGQAVRLCEATAFERTPRTIDYNPVLYPSAR